jgi:hypothetical protein
MIAWDLFLPTQQQVYLSCELKWMRQECRRASHWNSGVSVAPFGGLVSTGVVGVKQGFVSVNSNEMGGTDAGGGLVHAEPLLEDGEDGITDTPEDAPDDEARSVHPSSHTPCSHVLIQTFV